VLWLNVGSDSVIAASYFAIPAVIGYFVRHRRRELPHAWVPVLFASFIFLCGLMHLLGVWVVWNPDYRLDGLLKLATAIVSAGTAVRCST
jgi:Na+/H+ antiporter NhaD/arsenite permease-like protein